MKKSLIGGIVRIPMDDGDFCYARLLGGIDNVVYDFKAKIEDEDVDKIISSDILFAILSGALAREESGCKIIAKEALDERHQKAALFFDPDLTNPDIIDYTIKKVKLTMQYKTFEKGGIQDGGIYSAEHIKHRLDCYYKGIDYPGISNSLLMLENLRNFQAKK